MTWLCTLLASCAIHGGVKVLPNPGGRQSLNRKYPRNWIDMQRSDSRSGCFCFDRLHHTDVEMNRTARVYHCAAWLRNRWNISKRSINNDRLTVQLLAATKRLYERFSPSVRPSVCLSVCLSVRHNFFTMFPSPYHHEILRSYNQWPKWCHTKGQGQRSKVKVTEVKTQLSRFRTVTPV